MVKNGYYKTTNMNVEGGIRQRDGSVVFMFMKGNGTAPRLFLTKDISFFLTVCPRN